ncbi:MAG: J domain-containing protein [Myxococcaceae bacterium]
MDRHDGGGGRVHYFRCRQCRRWVSSTYADVLKADTGFRWVDHSTRGETQQAFEAATPAPEGRGFSEVKGRLERWLAALENQDPYRTLGVSPLDDDEVVRGRFRELALLHHPDRGGSADKMRELNVAYEQILRHREARRHEKHVLAESQVSLPARAR